MPYGDFMGGYGPRPDYGPGSDDYQLGQIKTGFQDAMDRFKRPKGKDEKVELYEEERQKAYNEMLHFKDQYDYMQTPTTPQTESFRPSSFESGRPASYRRKSFEVSEYANLYDDYMRRIENDPSISMAARVGSQASKLEEHLKSLQSAFRSGGMMGVEKYLREQRTRLR